jgi:hypothetical protein
MNRRAILITLFVFSSTLWSCASIDSTEGEPTRTSSEVLATAQARAELTREATFQTPPPTPITPSPTAPLVTLTPTTTPTPTPSQPTVTADYNANIRSGPDATYENIDFLLENQQGVIVSLYENETNGTWYFIEHIDQGRDGWIWSGAVTVSGDLSGVNVITELP